VRVHIAVQASALLVKANMRTSRVGGDRQRASFSSLALLVPSHCAVAAYLEPNSQSMQKPIGGGVAIGAEIRPNHAENHIKGVYRQESLGTVTAPLKTAAPHRNNFGSFAYIVFTSCLTVPNRRKHSSTVFNKNMSNQDLKTQNFYSNTMESYLSTIIRNHETVTLRRKTKWLNVQNAAPKSQNRKKHGKWQDAQTNKENACN
jgi:hypothetical protein